MLHKTRGLVLHYIKYRETSIIIKIYTEEFGIQSYIENGIRSTKSKNKIALFQPLTLLDLVVYYKENSIQRISEMRCYTPFSSIPFEFNKSSIALFITELLSKVLQEEVGNKSLFEFLYESLLWLDTAHQHYENFHLIFLLRLSAYLGFAPLDAQEIVLQLQENQYKYIIDADILTQLDLLIESDYTDALRLDRYHRSRLLDILLAFYQLHIVNMNEMKSLSVLKEVMK